MNGFGRGLRADLRLAARGACLLVLVGVALLAGLSSAVMQDAQYAQLQSAQYRMQQQPWNADSCGDAASCRRVRAEGRRSAETFLAQQTADARRIGRLQSASGVVAFAAAFMGLATGAVVIALLATLTLGGEWSRGTFRLALSGGTAPATLALRRFLALVLLGLAGLACAVVGAGIAAWWGNAARELPSGGDLSALQPLLGGLLLIVLYSALATTCAWLVREPLRSLSVTIAVVGIAAFTTSLGGFAPGAVIASALGIDRLKENEVGYLWLWPELDFSEGTPVRLISGPSWPAAAALVLVAIAATLTVTKRTAGRSDL